ncbi:hypothetical protein TTRE_0000067101 [Trichuris trichiura]|uniref:Uncharacterized protein n=1 Tax=Trichuris trichiura TaxID=36087 RepID=A0A077YWI8_TRITR|nr:hypothetical protein TTRE_0000067101 [Trichuris trichiura]
MADGDDGNTTADPLVSTSELATANAVDSENTPLIRTDTTVREPTTPFDDNDDDNDDSPAVLATPASNACGSSYEQLKRQVDEHRAAFKQGYRYVRKYQQSLIQFNEASAEKAMELTLLGGHPTTSTPNKNVSVDSSSFLNSSMDKQSSPAAAAAAAAAWEEQADLSQSSLRESLNAELLFMHRWWKTSIKDLHDREEEYLKLEKSFHELLLTKHARYVNLWHLLQSVKRDFSAFRSEIFRMLRCMDGDIQQGIRKNALMWEKINVKTIRRTCQTLRRFRSKVDCPCERTFVSAAAAEAVTNDSPLQTVITASQESTPLSVRDDSKTVQIVHPTTTIDDNTGDNEAAIAKHLQCKVEALENGIRECYSELNSVLASLMDVPPVDVPADAESGATFVSTSSCLALAQSLGKAVVQLKLAQKNLEQSLSEALLSLSEATSCHQQCTVRCALIEEDKAFLKKELTKVYVLFFYLREPNVFKKNKLASNHHYHHHYHYQLMFRNEENMDLHEQLDSISVRLVEATKAIEIFYGDATAAAAAAAAAAPSQDVSSLLDDIRAKDQQIARLQEEAQQRERTLLDETSRQNADNELLRAKVSALQLDLAKGKSRLESLQQIINNDKSELSVLKRERQQLIDKITQSEEQLENALLTAATRNDQENNNASKNLLFDRLERDNKALLVDKQLLTNKVTELETRLQTAESQRANLEQCVQNYQQQSEMFHTEQMESENNIIAVTRKLQTCALANNELAACIATLREERDLLENKLLHANGTSSDWESKYNAATRESNQIVSSLNLIREEVKTLEMQKAELQLLSTRFKSEADALSVEKAQREVENSHLNSKLVQMDRQLSDIQIQMEDLSKRYADSKQENIGLSDKLSTLNTLITEQNEALKVSEEDKELLLAENQGYAKLLEQKDILVKDLQQQLSTLTDNYAVQLSEADKLKEGMEQLAEEKNRLINACMLKKISLSESEQSVNMLTREQKHLKQKLAESDFKLETICDRNEKLLSDAQVKDAKILSLSAKLERCRTEKDNCDKRLKDCSARNKTAEAKALKLQNIIDLLTAEKHNFAEEAQKLRYQLELSKQQYENERKARREFEDRCAEMESHLEEANVQMKDMRQTVASSYESEQDLKHRLDTMTTKKEKWMTTCTEMKRNFNALQQEKNYLESKLRKEEDEYASILSELQQAKSREQQLLQAVETMNRDRLALDQAISSSESEKLMLVKEIQDLKNQILIREQNMADKLTDISTGHQKELQLLQDRRSDEKNMIAKLRRRIDQLEVELKDERKKHELSIVRSAESLLDATISRSNSHISMMQANNHLLPDGNI